MPPEALVTGATGRIGKHVVRELLDRKRTVRALCLPGDPRIEWLEDLGVRVIAGHLEDTNSVNVATAGVDEVFHLGAALTNRGPSSRSIVDSIALGTHNILEGIRVSGTSCRLVLASSTSVYYSGPESPYGDKPCDESTPIDPSTPYGAAKWTAELLVEQAARSGWCAAVIVRPSDMAERDELMDPSSVFGRRWFASSAIAYYLASEPAAADRVGPNVYQQLLRLPTNGLFYVTDASGREPMVQVGAASSMATFFVESLECARVGRPPRINAVPETVWPVSEFVRSIGLLAGLDATVSQLTDEADADTRWLFASSATQRRVADSISLP